MKKRSMLAVASLAAGVVASLVAPSAHAGPVHDNLGATGLPNANGTLDAFADQADAAAGPTVSGLGDLRH
ncbi:hypothetical protein [Kitasatospora sp. NBC_00315]|uniref:hypothetical protein n=1 Tax=Kitasatospora sp. NBC_00315 TaxID=2975963 RepID=UPI003249E6AE